VLIKINMKLIFGRARKAATGKKLSALISRSVTRENGDGNGKSGRGTSGKKSFSSLHLDNGQVHLIAQ
jgi:hypothetical protein